MPKPRGHNSSREQFWRDTITAWKASGQSVRAFCAARGLNEATFYARRRELATLKPPATSGTPSAGPSPTFAAVRVVPDPTVEVVLPAGLVLRVPVGADPAAVARLVAALVGQPCRLWGCPAGAGPAFRRKVVGRAPPVSRPWSGIIWPGPRSAAPCSLFGTAAGTG